MTDDSARFGKYRRQLDELSAAITQLHRRYVMARITKVILSQFIIRQLFSKPIEIPAELILFGPEANRDRNARTLCFWVPPCGIVIGLFLQVS